jgi:uncharacterized membrane protein YhhN
MTTPSLLLLAAAAVVAVGNWVARARGIRRLERATKPVATLLLLAVAASLGAADPAQQRWFLAALALSLAGDVLLMLDERRFAAGLAAFLLAHLAYVAGFAAAGIGVVPLLGGALAVAVVAVPVAGRIIMALRVAGQGPLVGPIVAYMAAIAAMVASAAGTRSALAVAGAALFLVSDSLLAWNRFVRPIAWAPVAVMVTYHLAQAALVLSLALP